MCGIAGIISGNIDHVSQERLGKMTDAIQHRGPEAAGFWCNTKGTVGFGHRRLSIIDLSYLGSQPMHYLQRYTISYNGEIYNYLELREELVKKGYRFTTHCDTEVVLAAYACYGKGCLEYFDGMFAFAIWDDQEQTLFCARDRFGEKPFYYNYSSQQNKFVFSSEMKSLWAAGINRKMDNGMLFNYLTLGWVQHPADQQRTFFEDIFSLPPSHYLVFKPETEMPFPDVSRYWDTDKETTVGNCSERTVQEKFFEIFETSVRRRLRSDVALGSGISGGLDSSSIVAMADKLLDKARSYKCFSAVFPGFEKDETKHVDQMVAQFGLENFKVTPMADGFADDFERLIYHQEEPFQSSSIYAQYKVYAAAKQNGVTVILDGQGADETIGGYTKYYHWYWQELLAKGLWSRAWNEIDYARKNGQAVDWNWKNYIAAFMPKLAANQLRRISYKNQVSHPELCSDFFSVYYNKTNTFKPTVSKLNDILYFNTMQFGLEELLRYADRNSMAHSAEVRLPFLNHELVQFVFSLPSEFKIKNGFTKYLLRAGMKDLLPASIVWRKDKVGFEPPQRQWMNNKRVQELILESRKKLVKNGILKVGVLRLPVRPLGAHDQDNFDWRYLCAAHCL